MPKIAFLAIIALVPGFHAALAQDDSGAELARIADELHELRAHAERVILDNAALYIISIGLGTLMAGLVIWATRDYKKNLEKTLANETQPILAWTQWEHKTSRTKNQRQDSKEIMIQITNVGRGAALNIDARYSAGTYNPPTFAMGALASKSSLDILIFISGKQYKQLSDDATIPIELFINYEEIGTNSYKYRLTGKYSRKEFVIVTGHTTVLPKR